MVKEKWEKTKIYVSKETEGKICDCEARVNAGSETDFAWENRMKKKIKIKKIDSNCKGQLRDGQTS